MDRQYIKSQITKLNNAYDKFELDQKQFNLWCECFGDCNPQIFEMAILNYIKENRFTPTIAGVMECYKAIEDYREEMKSLIARQYQIMRDIWEEPYDSETLKTFIDKVYEYPKEVRKIQAVEITHEAVSFYHDCIIEGKELPTLKAYLGGKT